MAASYPNAAKTFTAVNDGDTISDEMFEEAYDEIVALEQALLTSGLAHNLFPDSTANARTLGTASKHWGVAFLKAITLLDATELTIASGAVTVTQGYHKIDTESDAASDDLDTLTATGLTAGFRTILRAENVARVVTLKDGSGNLLLNGDFALSATDRSIELYYDGTNWRELARSVPTATAQAAVCEGRLSLTSGTSVTASDVTAGTTLYFALHGGNRIALYDGSAWNVRTFAELSITLVGLTASKPYDVWVYDNAGTPTLELLVWTNDTTRATALTKQDGVYVKTGATTRRYVGTIYIDAGGGAVTDSLAVRHVWNYYNRVSRPMRRLETTDSWTYSTATWRQANGSTANQFDVVVGVAEVMVHVSLGVTSSNDQANNSRAISIGYDSTTGQNSASAIFPYIAPVTASQRLRLDAHVAHMPAVGKHKYTWLEFADTTGTTTWIGDLNADHQSGMVGSIEA